MLCEIWYHLHNLKKREKHPWKSDSFSKVAALWVFFTFFKLNKWYQIAQGIRYMIYSIKIYTITSQHGLCQLIHETTHVPENLFARTQLILASVPNLVTESDVQTCLYLNSHDQISVTTCIWTRSFAISQSAYQSH